MVTAYPVMKKKKSVDICDSFIDFIGGSLVSSGPLREGPAFFYGVDDSNKHYWEAARDRGDFYYCDNSYFDSTRQEYFRITKDNLQHSGRGQSNCKRFEELGIAISPWREKAGKHIVVCPQSDYFMKVIAGYPGSWLGDIQHQLGKITPRPLRLRLWSPDKSKLAASLTEDLVGAHCLVTYSSAAAISAILAGIPAYCSLQCAALPVSIPHLEKIDHDLIPYERKEWAGILADNQWTLDEMRKGLAWDMLQKNLA